MDLDTFDTRLRPADIDPERPRPIETPWGSLSIYCVGGEYLASQSFCPHLAGPLFQGTRSGDEITCPWHQWRFSLRTGERVDLLGRMTPKRDALLVCDVHVEETLRLSNPRVADCRKGP